MAENMDGREQELRKQARERARTKMGFYQHVGAFLVVNAFLLVLDLLTSPGSIWFYWALLGWGIGLIAHAFNVYVTDAAGTFSRRLEQRELDKLRKEQQEPANFA